MQSIEGPHSYVTFRELGGSPIDSSQMAIEISRWPLDDILGFLGALSLEAVQAGADFSDPRRQGRYLQLAIVDDFPSQLPRVYAMYVPGRVPITGGRHLLVHEHNIAWLSHCALLYARERSITLDLSLELRRRVCRLLLIASDFLFEGSSTTPSSLRERRVFALHCLRDGQFNRFSKHSREMLLKLARSGFITHDPLSLGSRKPCGVDAPSRGDYDEPTRLGTDR